MFRLLRAFARKPLLSVAYLALGAWAVGLCIAAAQLGSWRQELSRTLLQLNADAYFRARAHDRNAVDPEWYRRKALALLSATQRLQSDSSWTWFMPGSWHGFDNLEDQVQARLDREFSDIVVETMRRELFARTSHLTGVPLVHSTGDLQAGVDCQSPVPQSMDRKLTAAAEDLPEFVAVADYVHGVEGLDQAVQSFYALQSSAADPEQLRKLVGYTLNQELPGSLASSVRMFHAGEEVNIQPALMQPRLQSATRCAMGKAMSALHTRLLNTNDLFALEQGLAQHSAGLFDAGARPVPFDRTLERYRTVHALLEDQNTFLSQGSTEWMRAGTLKLGPGYQEMLQRVAATHLLGPEMVQQLTSQSGAAFAEFRRQFEATFGTRGEPGIVWVEADSRFALSPERSALRDGLGALLKTSFMNDEAARGAPRETHDSAWLAKVTEEARALADERTRAASEIVPLFPERAQPVVGRVIDTRVSELIYQRAFRTLKASLLADAQSSLDPVAFRREREQVTALQALLKGTGAPALGDRLVATLDAELVRRLALLQEDWRKQPLLDGRSDDFAGWQGEPVAWVASATPDAAQPVVRRVATRADHLVQQAKGLLALGSPSLENDPAAARWQQLQAELDRYNRRAGDSSLVRLERYLAALGADFRKENCAERLAASAPAAGDDEIAERHMHLHKALLQRCTDLRTPAAVPAEIAPAAAAAAQPAALGQ